MTIRSAKKLEQNLLDLLDCLLRGGTVRAETLLVQVCKCIIGVSRFRTEFTNVM